MNSLPAAPRDNEQNDKREGIDQAYQISNFLKCEVDKNTLAVMIDLVEYGVKPEHVAMMVAEIKKAKPE